ncbi:nicotinic acetylcholine receptor subunit type c [Plakobranchus ocellatus]|uniref:Nicotinic acetylcholine receptor subunit type c n=1 Tax=Plakobranchus ocellatus TaxID=259542 RepID=A0AAV3YDA8_9GAST|nr:nicotinic acetylcholine receptor subunit type c [Plakobranchus ocellatus]
MDALSCLWSLLLLLLVDISPVQLARSMPDPAAKRLYYDLMTVGRYNELIRPSEGPMKKLTVKLGLRLSQVLAVAISQYHQSQGLWVIQKRYSHPRPIEALSENQPWQLSIKNGDALK